MGGAVAVTTLAAVAALAWGSHPIPLATVLDAFTAYDPTNPSHVVVTQSRVPRAILGVLVGAALATSGLVMQSFTRNPIADPGILGVNAGAAAGVVLAMAYLGITTIGGYLWFALAGAGAGAVVVYLLGSSRSQGSSPVRMTLAGAAFSIAIGALTAMVLASNESVFATFRYWAIGTLQGRGLDIIVVVAPLIVLGLVLALALIRPLNALALGEEAAIAVGVSVARARIGAVAVVVLLAGSATAAVGPIGFVGLATAHIVRVIVGPDHRYLLPATLVCGPALLLSADVLGRVAAAPAELQTGIAAAVMGGPLFIMLVRSKRLMAL
ncbi:MAG: iron chelate uptake ABC transporter family permease subunit [Propioniciclava sp.]|jgi:iron complex transport system permease protein